MIKGLKLNKNCFLIILLAAIMVIPAGSARGATRFYLRGTGAAAAEVNPTYSTSWGDTSAAAPARLRLSRFVISTTSLTRTTPTDKIAKSYLCNQYVSDPIAGQTISGTISGEAQGYTSAAVNAYSEIVVRVVSNDGSTVRGTLLAMTKGGTIYPTTTATGRAIPASTSLSSVEAQNGDRIVVEVGITREATTPNRSVSQVFRSDSATDLTEGATAANNPWIEFSQNIIFPSQGLVEF